MNVVKLDMKTVKTVTDEVTRWKQAGMGAFAVTGIASFALTALVVSWSEILAVLPGR